MNNLNINTNIAGDLEIQNRSTLAFDMPVIVTDGSETLVDEFNADVYLGARLTATVTNEIGQIEINEFMIVHDGTAAYIRNLNTLNNISANTFISIFTVVLVRGFIQIKVTCSGNKNQVRIFKLMFKK